MGILALAFVRGQWQGCLAVPAGPESPEEVIAIAQRLGLHCCTDCADGRLEHTLYVSYLPIPWREANALCLRDPRHPSWGGRVAVRRVEKGFAAVNVVPGYTAFWGNLFLYGDPTLVEQLVQARR